MPGLFTFWKENHMGAAYVLLYHPCEVTMS